MSADGYSDDHQLLEAYSFRVRVGGCDLISSADRVLDVSGQHSTRSEFCSEHSQPVHGGDTESALDRRKHVMRYVAGTVDYGLHYVRGDGVRLVGYSDSDWTGCVSDRKSTSGCCFGLGSAVVSWFSRKQKSVALSSAEAEYMATSQASCEVIWLRKLPVGLFG